MLYSVFFFFFKQKTAYEMRISDWSSDVCSSDLQQLPAHRHRGEELRRLKGPSHAEPGAVVGGQGIEALRTEVDRALRRPYEAADREIGRASCRERVCQYV